MKTKIILLISFLCLVKLSIHLVGNQNYGFHRDELLHLSVSEHLAWGYMEFPPFIAWIGKVATMIFGHSLSGIRLVSTLAGIGIIILTCMMTIEMGGRKPGSVMIAGVAVLSFLPYYRNHTLFQPVAFDQLFWTLGFYLLVLFLNRKENKYLIYLGITCGFGLLNKYTFILWIAGVVIALLFYDKASVYKNKHLYIALGIVVLMVLPNILWQINNDFPVVLHQQRLKEVQLDKLDRLEFLTDQLQFVFTFLLSVLGIWGMFANKEIKRFRVLAISVLLIFAFMWVLQAKSYYFFAVYPVVFAAGAVMLEKMFGKREWLIYPTAFILFAPIVYFIPMLTPVFPIERFVSYADIKPDEGGRYKLTGDYADMYGWAEQVKLIDSIYRALPEQERSDAVIWAENYGEAGAVKILGDAYNLPDPFCVSGSFWTFGPPPSAYSVCISIGNEAESVNRVFEHVRLVRMIKHRYAIDEEHNIPVYICRRPRIDFRERWPEFKKYIFN